MSVAKTKEVQVVQELKEFAEQFDPFMRHFFDEQSSVVPMAARGMIQNLSEFCLRGGKRLRPYVVSRTYRLFGGDDRDNMMVAALLPELVHGFLLIHDDVMDRDDERRGGPTLQKVYEREFKGADASHLGNSMAILAGDLLYNLSGETLSSLSVSSDIKLQLWQVLQQAVRNTIFGQELDLRLGQQGSVDVSQRLAMYQYKTAYYSFEAPMRIGGIVAGADTKDLELLSEYAIRCGVAFQIMDDLIDGEGLSGGHDKARKYVGDAKRSLEQFVGPQYDQPAKHELAALADFIVQREV